MVSWYKYLIVYLVFSHLGFWSGNLFLIAPFPDLCLFVPFSILCIVLLGRTREHLSYASNHISLESPREGGSNG